MRVFGKAYTSQVLPFGERVMYKYTSVPAGNLDQRWCHGIWVGMDNEHPSATEAIETGEKLDSEEVRKGRAKEVRELDEFDVKMEVDESEMRSTPGKKIWSKCVETRRTQTVQRYDVDCVGVNTGESRSDTFAATPPLKFVRLILSWAASYKRSKRVDDHRCV